MYFQTGQGLFRANKRNVKDSKLMWRGRHFDFYDSKYIQRRKVLITSLILPGLFFIPHFKEPLWTTWYTELMDLTSPKSNFGFVGSSAVQTKLICEN